MIKTMALRDLKARYIGSSFGVLWAILSPAAEVLIYGIIFGIFLKSRPDPIYGTNNFFIFLICGLIPWQFFIQTTQQSTHVLVQNITLIKKAIGFPSEILPIINVISNIINHAIGLGLLFVILLIFTAKLTPQTLAIPIYLFIFSLFTIGLGWILSSLNVYLRDVGQIVTIVLTGLFFFTPIFYSPGSVPKDVLILLKLNPVYHIVDGYRYALLAGSFIPLNDFIYFTGISLFTFGIGGLFFRRLKPGFAEVL
jgi:ABC-type polysaccharide/polyol phosphate export permease